MPSRSAPPPLPAPEGALPHLPGAWVDSDVIEAATGRLAALERFFCAFDGAPKRCSRRLCHGENRCHAKGRPGEIFRACRGKPGAHVRHWIVGLWAAYLHDLMGFAETDEEDAGEA